MDSTIATVQLYGGHQPSRAYPAGDQKTQGTESPPNRVITRFHSRGDRHPVPSSATFPSLYRLQAPIMAIYHMAPVGRASRHPSEGGTDAAALARSWLPGRPGPAIACRPSRRSRSGVTALPAVQAATEGVGPTRHCAIEHWACGKPSSADLMRRPSLVRLDGQNRPVATSSKTSERKTGLTLNSRLEEPRGSRYGPRTRFRPPSWTAARPARAESRSPIRTSEGQPDAGTCAA